MAPICDAGPTLNQHWFWHLVFVLFTRQEARVLWINGSWMANDQSVLFMLPMHWTADTYTKLDVTLYTGVGILLPTDIRHDADFTMGIYNISSLTCTHTWGVWARPTLLQTYSSYMAEDWWRARSPHSTQWGNRGTHPHHRHMNLAVIINKVYQLDNLGCSSHNNIQPSQSMKAELK